MPHVMNYQEILDAAKTDKTIYEEIKGKSYTQPLHFDGVDFVSTDPMKFYYLLVAECDEKTCLDYNWSYRCWDSKPSESLMKLTPWKDNPYKTKE